VDPNLHISPSRSDLAVAQGLSHVDAAVDLGGVEIGDGARHAQDPVIAARREAKALGRLAQELAAVCLGRRHLFQQLAVGVGVGADRSTAPRPRPS
jgi:hypothetical protein